MEKSDKKEMESGDEKEMESGDESMNDEPEVRKQPVVRRSDCKMNSLNICYKGFQTFRREKNIYSYEIQGQRFHFR